MDVQTFGKSLGGSRRNIGLGAHRAVAVPFDFIRVGNLDGFGYTTTAGLVRATGVPHPTPADTNGNNLLQQTEFLPDLDKNGAVATGNGDDFDNRSAAEKANTAAAVSSWLRASRSRWHE